MAGQRYAKLTIQVSLSHNDAARGQQTSSVTFELAGHVITLYRGGDADQFIVPDPDQVGVGEEYVIQCVRNVLALLGARIFGLGLPFTVSAPRAVGTRKDPNMFDPPGDAPLVEFDITATAYSTNYGSDLSLSFEPNFTQAWVVTQSLSNISPVYATAAVTDTGIYGSADGVIDLTASGGDSKGLYLYAWADGVNGAHREKLAAGTYPVTISDGSTGASITLEPVVKSDPLFVVQVSTTPNSITLLASGGVAPYSYQWADGPTTAARKGLPAGTYECVVLDAHGARRDIEVVLGANDRYWFSGNPITLSLDAGPAYRADPATLPGLSFVCQVFVEHDYLSDVFAQAGQDLEQPADAGGRTTFEVQELLEPFVEPVLPGLGQSAVQRVEGTFRRFYLKYYQRTTAGDGAITTIDTNYLVHGGLDYYEAAAGTWFSSYQAKYRPFLTWEPPTKKVLPDQPEYLYFMMPAAASSSFCYRLRAGLANGAQLDEVLVVRRGVLAGEIFCLPAGPLQLDLASREASTGQLVTRYTLSVEDEDGAVLSETRTFVLDRRPCPVRRYFLYANSLGGWNTLVCRGRAVLDLATKTSASENARTAGYDPLRGDYTTNRRTGLPTLHCYTGARSAAQLVADRDFLLSERVLLLQEGRYLAGQVKDRTVTVLDEDETRRVVQFDYELPRERYFTPHLRTS